MPTTILVPLDLGREADRALPVARALADRLGCRLDVVVVSDATAEAAADEAEVRAHARAAGVEVDGVHLRYDDDVAAGVLAQAEASDATLCLASHAYPPVVATLAGSVGTALVRRDTGPLVLVGPDCELGTPGGVQLLACVDDHAGGAVAAVAVEWAALLGAKLRALTVDEDGATPAGAHPSVEAAGPISEWEVVTGRAPEEAILAAARRMGDGLVVMGTSSGRHGPALGRVGRAVVRNSPRPVLLVPCR